MNDFLEMYLVAKAKLKDGESKPEIFNLIENVIIAKKNYNLAVINGYVGICLEKYIDQLNKAKRNFWSYVSAFNVGGSCDIVKSL